MHLVPLHNVLLSTAKLLNADAVALRLLPSSDVSWQPLDVAVGDTALLHTLHWREGERAPQPPGIPQSKALFDLPKSVELFLTRKAAAMKIAVSDELLTALPGQFKSFEKRGNTRAALGDFWLALAFERDIDLANWLDYDDTAASLAELVIGVAAQTLWGLYQSQQAHADPITGLPGTEEFRARLHRLSNQKSTEDIGLFIIGIDEYPQRRRLLGQEHAEQLLRTAARLLEHEVRKDDALFCYREAQFAVLTQIPNYNGAQLFAQKLHRALQPLKQQTAYHAVSASVGFLLGADADSYSLDPHGFCLSAEQALDHARLSGGDCVIRFSGAFAEDETTQRHLVSSLLTDPERGYRNNYILWQTMALLAHQAQPGVLAEAFVALLKDRLEASVVMLLDNPDGTLVRLDAPEFNLDQSFSELQRNFVNQAFDERQVLVDNASDAARQKLAIPLVSRELLHGCLYIESVISFDVADRVFLAALADQLAAGLDRAKLVRGNLAEHIKESDALRAKLSDLQQHSDAGPEPVTHSSSMQAVMDFVHRIAPTDVSVLIMGESGVGKEVMARAIHNASNRAAAALVVVDCSAITPTLIESELFGRVKGAYTGADAASDGRIAQAHEGTLFLDEIGELPLDVQAKLLRFVQEKEVVAVGDTQTRYIDTRIVCATNRNLQEEVSAGRFRADLYFRLQAIQVQVPALRERRDDLGALVDVFLERFNQQFDRQVTRLSEAAWQKVITYPWPGNVRELQNTIMRAVLTASGETLEVGDLQLSELPPGEQYAADAVVSAGGNASQQAPAGDGLDLTALSANDALAQLLRQQIKVALGEPNLSPLGRWLTEALVLCAWERHNRVVVAAARALGMPETTMRRQLNKARESQQNPLQLHSSAWLAALSQLNLIFDELMGEVDIPTAVAEYVDMILLNEILNAIQDDVNVGAALLGVTPPTYTRRVEALHALEISAAREVLS